MGIAIMAFIITLIVGLIGMALGLEVFGGYPEVGSVLAIAVMGAIIVYINEKKK